MKKQKKREKLVSAKKSPLIALFLGVVSKRELEIGFVTEKCRERRGKLKMMDMSNCL